MALPDAAGVDEGGLRTDGPTLEEYTKAGYSADSYPPRGYTVKTSEANPLGLTGKQLAEHNQAQIDPPAPDAQTAADPETLDPQTADQTETKDGE